MSTPALSISPELASLRPVAATVAIVIRDGHVLLVRRANPPDVGRWGFPGGKIDPGETIETAAVRELREETGVLATAHRAFTAVDAFDYDNGGRLRHHYVLVAVLCIWSAGEPIAGDDALEASWIALDRFEQGELELSLDVAQIARQGAEIARRERVS